MSDVKRKRLNSGSPQPVMASAGMTEDSRREAEKRKEFHTTAMRLYEASYQAKELGQDHHVAELLRHGVATDEAELGACAQHLVNIGAFVPYKLPTGVVVYRLRQKTVAAKVGRLQTETRMIYEHIESTGRNGIWKKNLVQTANLHENNVTKALKELINGDLVKEFKTSKNTAKRMYILAHLEPSEKSTGGAFYRDGELDDGLVVGLSDFIANWVEQQSWATGCISTKPDAANKKNTDHGLDVRETVFSAPRGNVGQPLVVRAKNSKCYPTATDILDHITETGILRDITLSLNDIKQLIIQLIHDDRLEDMGEGSYRSVRRVWQRDTKLPNPLPLVGPADLSEHGYGFGNGLTQIPCGRCPVKKDCHVGGIVSPESCEYMAKWLEQLF